MHPVSATAWGACQLHPALGASKRSPADSPACRRTAQGLSQVSGNIRRAGSPYKQRSGSDLRLPPPSLTRRLLAALRRWLAPARRQPHLRRPPPSLCCPDALLPRAQRAAQGAAARSGPRRVPTSSVPACSTGPCWRACGRQLRAARRGQAWRKACRPGMALDGSCRMSGHESVPAGAVSCVLGAPFESLSVHLPLPHFCTHLLAAGCSRWMQPPGWPSCAQSRSPRPG